MKGMNRTFFSAILLASLGMGFAWLVVIVPTVTAAEPDWVGDIGINYSPNHYPDTSMLNFSDVFYVGMANNMPVTNIYVELAQLKAAGFNIVRTYQVDPFPWIEIIKQANALGMYVVYEASLQFPIKDPEIMTAQNNLAETIAHVTPPVFKNTVALVLAGHENYLGQPIDQLKNAIKGLLSTLRRNGLSSVPVGTALKSDFLVGSPIRNDIRGLIKASSTRAPLGFDPYPFQWGVSPAKTAATGGQVNSIASDYQKIQKQSWNTGNKKILMAESGWATAGIGQTGIITPNHPNGQGYFCWMNPTTNPCEPSVQNAADYLQNLYTFVRNTGNKASVLVFEAYDEPAKDSSPVPANSAEAHYGVFDSNCNLKDNNTRLLPTTSWNQDSTQGCQGFAQGTLLTIVGYLGRSHSKQPPFQVKISQTNPQTGKDASIDLTVSAMGKPVKGVTEWPHFLVYDDATVQVTSASPPPQPKNSCTVTATVNTPGGSITWTQPQCTGAKMTCNGNNCFLPNPY